MTKQPKKKLSDTAILGINLAVFVIYTAIFIKKSPEMWLNIGLLQMGICFILSIIMRRLAWFLAALMILLVGFATCVGAFSLETR